MIWSVLQNKTREVITTTNTVVQSCLNNIQTTLNVHAHETLIHPPQPKSTSSKSSVISTDNVRRYDNPTQTILLPSVNNTSYNRSKSISASLNPTPIPTIDKSLFRWLNFRPTSSSKSTSIIEESDEQYTATASVNTDTNTDNRITMAQPSHEETSENSGIHLAPWGDPLPVIKTSNTLRIIYQNVHHSLQPSSNDPNTLQLVENLQTLRCGIFCASETNLNWAHHSNKRNIRQVFERGFVQVHMSTSSSAIGKHQEHKDMKYLPGGSAIFTFDQWASKITTSGEDERQLGRWAYTTITGKNNRHITIISAYRTIRQGPYSGALTAHSQQVFLLESERLQMKSSSINAPIPRDECIKDLDLLIQKLQAQEHGIILCIDANETPSESCNSKGEPKRHSIEALLQSRGLLEVFMQHHNDTPSSTTTTENRFLDRVAVWNVPLHRVTLLGVHHPAQSDHLGIAIDINTNDLFGCQYSPLQQSSLRRLTLNNKQACMNYQTNAIKQITTHNILKRAECLHQKAIDQSFTESDRQTLISLDNQLTEILLSSERKCSKRQIQRDPWSPKLKAHGKAVIFWRRKLFSLKYPNIDQTSSLRSIQKAAEISDTLQQSVTTIQQCKMELHRAWTNLKSSRRQAFSLREQHLTNLAEALADSLHTTTDKAATIINNKEHDKQTYRKIAIALGKSKKPLTQIDIPTKDGSWITLTQRPEIHDHLLQFNQNHFRQANDTPFGQHGTLAHHVDPLNPNNQHEELLSGTATFLEDTTPELDQWIQELEQKSNEEIDLQISEEDFIHCFRRMKEHKASSPSGRHVGHYILAAKIDNPILRRIYCLIAATAIQSCSPLPRWEMCLQIMLEKGKGHRIDKLRILQLVEADLNFVLKLLWGSRLNQAAYKNNLYNESQYAIIGKTCTSAIFNKVLFADLTRQTKRPASMMDNDNAAAFDRVLPALSIVTCRRLGLPKSAAIFLFTLLRAMEFKVGTGHGISDNTYHANEDPNNPGQGSGQGQGSGPMLYGASADVTLSTYSQYGTGAVFQHPAKLEIPREDHVGQFVDDATQFLNLDGIESRFTKDAIKTLIANTNKINGSPITQIANENSKKWSVYNWASGGKLNFEKCFWYLLHPTWNGKKYKLASKDEISGELDILNFNDDRSTRIQRFEPHEAQRTLGVLFAPDGNNKQQLITLQGKAQKWASCIRVAHLQANEKWISYRSVLKPSLLYPLPTHRCSAKDLAPIQKIIDREIIHSQHLNISFPRAVLRGPLEYGGLGIPSLHSENLAEKIVYFIHHIRRNDAAGHKLRCSLGHLQLEIGIGENILMTNFEDLGFLATECFITDLWRECSNINITLHGTEQVIWVPKLQSVNDQYLMDLAAKHFSKKQLVHINMCRMFTKTVSVSDLTTHDGDNVHTHYYYGLGNSGRCSNYSWPETAYPPRHYWHTWRLFISKAIGYPSLVQPLGEWHSLPTYSQQMEYKFDHSSDRLFRFDIESAEWFHYERRISRGPSKFHNIPIQSTTIPQNLVMADVQVESDRIILLCTSNRDDNSFQCNTLQQSQSTTTDTLQDHFNQLPASLQRICGHIILPDDDGIHLAQAAMDGSLLGVSDGSVKDNKATHAWTLTTDSCDPLAMKGCGPVDGNASTLSSFRSEVQGQVALLIMITLLVRVHNVTQSSFTSICDNQGALKRLQPLETGLRLHHHKEADADLLLTFRQWSDTNIKRTSQWVRGHQDSLKQTADLTDIERINVDMDYLADAAYELPYELTTCNTQEVLPAEIIAVFFNDTKITTHLKETIIHAYHAPSMETYISKKHNLNDYDMDHINWKGIKSTMTKQKMNQRAVTSKFIHGWLPTQAFLHKQHRSSSPYCPICTNLFLPETTEHIVKCPHPHAIIIRTNLLNKCLKTLYNTEHTSPLIINCWDECLRRKLNLPANNNPWKCQRPYWIVSAVRIAHCHQNILGWDKFLRGIISNKWIIAQHLHAKAFPSKDPKRGKGWEFTSTKHILQIGLQVWKWRNDFTHGATLKENKLKTRDATLNRVKKLYLNPPSLLKRFPAVKETLLLTQLQQDTRHLQAWLQIIDQQILITNSERQQSPLHFQSSSRNNSLPLSPDPGG